MRALLGVLYWRFLVTSPNSDARRRAAAELGKTGSASAVRPILNALAKPIRFEARDILSDIEETRYETNYLVDALVALGPVAVPGLVRALEETSDFVREGAAKALGTLGDARAVEPLARCLQQRPAAVVAESLGKLGDPRAIPALAADLDRHVDDESSRASAKALARLNWVPDDDARHVWFELLNWPYFSTYGGQSQRAAHAAQVADRLRGRPRAFEALAECLKHRPSGNYTPPALDERAAWVLGELGDVRAVAPLAELLQNLWRPGAAIEALEKLRAVDPLLDSIRGALSERQPDGRRNRAAKPEVLQALTRLGDPRAIPLLQEYVLSRPPHDKSDNAEVLAVAKGLRQFGQPATMALRGFLKDGSAALRELAHQELVALGWKPASDEDRALAAFADPTWTDLPKHGELVVEWLIDADEDQQAQKEEALVRVGKVAVAPLLKRLAAGDMSVTGALGKLGDERAAAPLAELYRADRGQPTSNAAIAALAMLGNTGVKALLFNSDSLPVKQRLRLVEGLAAFQHSHATGALSVMGGDPDEGVRTAAKKVAAKLQADWVTKSIVEAMTDADPRVVAIAKAAMIDIIQSKAHSLSLMQGGYSQADIARMQQALDQIGHVRLS